MSTVRVTFALALATLMTVTPQAAQHTKPPAVTVVSTVPPPATALEALLTAPGVLVSRDLYRVTDDTLARSFGLVIEAVVANGLAPSTDHLLGLRVEVAESGATPRSRTSYVDDAELAGLSQAVTQMIDLAGRWTGREDARATEAQYATLGGFTIGFHQDGRNQFGFVAAGSVDPVRMKCAVRDFVIIKADLDAAADVLKNK
jgi:hypothetical protein